VGASRVAITGATGLIGSALADALRRRRHPGAAHHPQAAKAGPDDVVWDPAGHHRRGQARGRRRGRAPRRGADRRPALDRRDQAPHPRQPGQGTDLIARTLAELDDKPRCCSPGSAVGYYGDRGDEVLTEESTPGDDFLARGRDRLGGRRAAREGRGHPRDPPAHRGGARQGRAADRQGRAALPPRRRRAGRVRPQYVAWISLRTRSGRSRSCSTTTRCAAPSTSPRPTRRRTPS
jgi:uncharacterized protein